MGASESLVTNLKVKYFILVFVGSLLCIVLVSRILIDDIFDLEVFLGDDSVLQISLLARLSVSQLVV